MGQVSTAEKLREILFCPNCIKRHVIASYSENCISLVPSILTSQSTSLLSLYYGGELVMQQYNFRCGYNIHSLLVSHAISSSLRKKNPIDEKDLAFHTAILHIIQYSQRGSRIPRAPPRWNLYAGFGQVRQVHRVLIAGNLSPSRLEHR